MTLGLSTTILLLQYIYREQPGSNTRIYSAALGGMGIFFRVALVTILLITLLYHGYHITPTSPVKNDTSKASGDKHRQGDGCFHIFLDVGANIGVHGRFLFEMEEARQRGTPATIRWWDQSIDLRTAHRGAGQLCSGLEHHHPSLSNHPYILEAT